MSSIKGNCTKLLVSLFVIFILFINPIYSQYSYRFQKSYGTIQLEDLVATEEAHNGYILAGDFANFPVVSPTYGLLVKTFFNGDFSWSNIYYSSSTVILRHAIETTDLGFIVVGSVGDSPNQDLLLMKVDSVGNVLWTKKVVGPFDDYASRIVITNAGYLVLGRTESYGAGSSDLLVLKIDESGTLIWAKTYGGNAQETVGSIQTTSDGGAIIAGGTSSFGLNSSMYVIKIDSNGNEIWSKAYGGLYNFMEGSEKADEIPGGFIMSFNSLAGPSYGGNFAVVRTSDIGDTLWTSAYGFSGEYQMLAYGSELSKDGNMIVSGYRQYSPGQYYGINFKVDLSGRVMWAKTNTVVSYQSKPKRVSDDGFIFCATSGAYFSSGGNDFHITKTDEESLSGCYEDSSNLIKVNAPFINLNTPTVTTTGVSEDTVTVNSIALSLNVITVCQDSVLITVPPELADTFLVPNIISPNGDMLNDFFPGNPKKYYIELQVFNRWGNLLYENSNTSNGWDGQDNKGNVVSDGTYYYKMKVKFSQSKFKEYHGYLQVLTAR